MSSPDRVACLELASDGSSQAGTEPGKAAPELTFFIWVLPFSRPPNQLKSLGGRDKGNKGGPPHQGTEKQRDSERFRLIHSKARG